MVERWLGEAQKKKTTGIFGDRRGIQTSKSVSLVPNVDGL